MNISKINRGLKKVKWTTNDMLFAVGLKSLPKKSFGKQIIIYHGVTNNAITDINARFISTQLFEQQIAYFKKHFNVVTLEDYFNGTTHPDKLTLAITFDDGYLNNLIEALPILEKHKIPATFFITTVQQFNANILWADALDLFRYTTIKNTFEFNGIIYQKSKKEFTSKHGSLKQLLKQSDWKLKKQLIELVLKSNSFINNESLKPYHQLLSEKDIITLSKSHYAEIGSHALYHNCLTQITLNEAKNELVTSKTYLENLIQTEVTSFAYPDGDYNQELIKCIDSLGYKNQLVVDYIAGKDKTSKQLESRFGINPYISFNNQIQCLIDGKY